MGTYLCVESSPKSHLMKTQNRSIHSALQFQELMVSSSQLAAETCINNNYIIFTHHKSPCECHESQTIKEYKETFVNMKVTRRLAPGLPDE